MVMGLKLVHAFRIALDLERRWKLLFARTGGETIDSKGGDALSSAMRMTRIIDDALMS